MTLGKKIYALRMKCNMTQEQLAEQLDVSRQSISKYEYGQSTPELEKIKQLAKIFGVTTEELINDEIDLTEDIDAGENEYNDEEEIINDVLETDSDISEIEIRLVRLEGRVESLDKKREKISNNRKIICVLLFVAFVVMFGLVVYLNSLSVRLKRIESNMNWGSEAYQDVSYGEGENYPALCFSVGVSCDTTEKGKDGITNLKGKLDIDASTRMEGDSEMKSCLEYLKVAFLDGDSELYGYTLTKWDISNIQMYNESVISYKFEIENENFNGNDGPVLYLEYDNPFINKRVCMVSDTLTDGLLGNDSWRLYFEPADIWTEEIPK